MIVALLLKKLLFPPGEEVTVVLSIPYVTYYTGATLIGHIEMTVNVGDVTCPYCDGEGTVTEATECWHCDGTGHLECPECGVSGYVEESLIANPNGSINFGLIAGVTGAVVAVATVGGGSFVLLKRKRVSEKSLRNLSGRDFQAWVLKK